MTLIDFRAGDVVQRLTNNSPAAALAWNAEGTGLACALCNGRVHIWRKTQRRFEPSTRMPSFGAPGRHLAFHPDGTLLAVACVDRTLRVLDTTANRWAFEGRCDAHRIQCSADGQQFGPVFRGDEAGWFAIRRPVEFREFTVGNTDLQLQRCAFDAESAVVAVSTTNRLHFFDVVQGRRVHDAMLPRFAAMAMDPLGEMLIASAQFGFYRYPLLRPAPGQFERGEPVGLVRRTRNHGWSAFAFNADGQRFAAANVHSNAVFLFDRTLTNLLAEIGPHRGADAVALSPDARWLATGSAVDRQVRVWDTRTGSNVLALGVGSAPRAAFSGDGRWLATFGDTFRLHHAGSWEPAPLLPFPQGRPLTSVATFSRDGRLLAVVCDLFTIQLFDLAHFRRLGVLRPPGGVAFNDLDFSPDGRWLVAVGLTARLRVWDLQQIRERLVEYGLGWDLPAWPPPVATNAPAPRAASDR